MFRNGGMLRIKIRTVSMVVVIVTLTFKVILVEGICVTLSFKVILVVIIRAALEKVFM
jgi:hypothetical protein